MADLEERAKKRGASTIGVQTTIERLSARRRQNERFACIALLELGHYVLLYDADHSLAYVVDPPRSYTVPRDTFDASWTHKVLLSAQSH